MKNPILITMLLVALGCETDRPDSDFFSPNDVGTLVVDATLIVGERMPGIRVTRAIAPGEFYDPFREGVDGATVTVTNTRTQEIIAYGQFFGPPGAYQPSDLPEPIVESSVRYDLRILTTEGEIVTASTTTPDVLSVDEWLLLDDTGRIVRRQLNSFLDPGDIYQANQLVYTDGLLEARFAYAGDQRFQVGVESLDKDSDFVIDPKFFDEEDFADLERLVSSPGFEALDNKLRLPWFVIFFQGRYKLKVFAVDENWWDLILTLPENSPGIGGLIGDNFERPQFHVNGGIGLFGSASVDSVGFFVLPKP